MVATQPTVHEVDPVWQRICDDARDAISVEPLMGGMMSAGVLHHDSFEDALAYRLAMKLGSQEMSAQTLREIADRAYESAPALAQSARTDLVAIVDRDPACHRFLQPLMFFKGFQAVQAYRLGHWLWQQGQTDLAYYMQMRISEIFGVDIHPAAKIGNGIMIDHAHSIVVGETAVVGDNVSMLHSVTLGGTGKEDDQRHPVGHCSRIAAGSVVLQDVPPMKTVAGVPAKIVGEAGCSQPSISMDQLLQSVDASAATDSQA